MLVTVEAHHSKEEHFRDAICGEGAVNNLSETHCLMGKTTFEILEGYPNSAVCEEAFHTFNWMTKGRGMGRHQKRSMTGRVSSIHMPVCQLGT